MFYLIYVSSATKLMDDDDLLALQRQASEYNNKTSVTGMLLYQDGTFMQMLEGEKKTVLNLYDKIQTDARHKGIITILQGKYSRKEFPELVNGVFQYG